MRIICWLYDANMLLMDGIVQVVVGGSEEESCGVARHRSSSANNPAILLRAHAPYTTILFPPCSKLRREADFLPRVELWACRSARKWCGHCYCPSSLQQTPSRPGSNKAVKR